MPRVSVLIPTYNAEETILRALTCAQNQTHQDLEIIVIDDASTDRTVELVLARQQLDPRIQLCRQPQNAGPAVARNAGLRIATGEWIGLLDADDTMTLDRFECLLARALPDDVLIAGNLDLYDYHAGRSVKLGIDPRIIGKGLRLDCAGFVRRCQTNQPSAVDFGLLKPLMRAAHLRAHGIVYDESLRYGEDFRLYLDALLAGGMLHLAPEAYYRYTERTGSISRKRSAITRTEERYDRLEAQTRALAANPKYAIVAAELNLRADAIRRLSKAAAFRRRSFPRKLASLPRVFTDPDLQACLTRSVAKFHPALWSRYWSGSSLLKDASNLCLGQGIKLVLQAIYFLLIARSLGPSQYGAFIAITAMTSILAPYVGLGCGSLFLKNVRSGKRTEPVCWGNGLLATLVTGSLITCVLAVVASLWLPAFPLPLVLAICLSDLVLVRVIDLASFGFAASGKMSKTAVQNTTMSLLRVLGIIALVLLHRSVTIQQWTWVYLVTGVVGAAFAVQQGTSLWGAPRLSFSALVEDAREGSFFSISTSAQTIYNDIDKTMLAHLSTFAATGVYGAAYRIIDTSLTPIRSLVSAAYPQFFRLGAEGLDATYGYARRLIRKALVFGALDFLALMALAPLLPHILGPRYAAVAPAVRWLALIPVMRCVHWFLADALSGANLVGLRTAVQVAVAALNIGLNLLVLPRWSWVGAAWTSLASDAVLTAAVFAIVQWKLATPSPQVKELVHALE